MKKVTFIADFVNQGPTVTYVYHAGYEGVIDDEVYAKALKAGAIKKEEVKVGRSSKAK